MAQNIIGSKENMLKWLSDQIGENDCVIITDDLREAQKGRNGATVKFRYIPGTFQEDAKDIRLMLEGKNIAVSIGKPEKLTKEAHDVFIADKNHKPRNT